MLKRLLLISLMVALPACSAEGEGDVEGFYKTWDKAKAAAIAEGKPIYLHFTTTWCGWCRKIESDTYKSEIGRQALSDFVAASLDCTDENDPTAKFNRAMMHKFGGNGYPFLVMVTPEQVSLGSQSGYVTPKPFAAMLAKGKRLYSELADFEAFAAKADKDSYAFNLRAMKMYARTGQLTKAAHAGEKIRKLDPSNARGDGVQAELAVLAATAEDKPTPERTARIAERVAVVRKLDPANSVGGLQQALVIQSKADLESLQTMSAPGAKAALMDSVAERLTELGRVGKDVDELQLLWAYLGQANVQAGRKTQALDALTRAVAANPASPIAAKIKEFMSQVKEKM